MFRHCPGTRSIVQPQIILSTCPYCGGEVEFFEYEVEITCPYCGKKVRREPSQLCIFWCKAAVDCIKNLVALGILDSGRADELLTLLNRYRREG